MRQLKKFIGKLFSPVCTLLSLLLSLLIPRHGKRILFNTSVYFELSKETYPGPKTLRRLNAALKLAADTQALELPARLHKLFWSNKLDEIMNEIKLSDVIEGQDPCQIELFCAILVSSTPRWMMYGRRSDMIRDVKRVIERAREDYLSRGLLPQT